MRLARGGSGAHPRCVKLIELLWDAREGASALDRHHAERWLIEAEVYAVLAGGGDLEATSSKIPNVAAEVYPVPREGGVLGSAKGCEARIQLASVSARHAELEARPGGVFSVRDLSTRGTSVNGTRVPPRVALPISPGAELRLGEARLTFLTSAQLCEALTALLVGLPEVRPLPEGSTLIARCESIGAVLLPEGVTVTLGRAKDAGLVLPHPNVSRYHATLTRAGDEVRVCDLGSSNGTWIGRTPVGEGADVLRPGTDRLRVGPFELGVHVLVGDDHGMGTDTSGQTRVETRRVEELDIRGRLEVLPLRQLLQSVEINARTGTIRIDAVRGAVVFAEGAPLWATYGDEVGEGALQGLLDLEQGAFRFEPAEDAAELLEPPSEEARLEGNFTRALLTYSVRHDETGR